MDDINNYIKGSNVWITCHYTQNYYLKNLETQYYLEYSDNQTFIESLNEYPVFLNEGEEVEGYTIIHIKCYNNTWVLGYENDFLKLDQFYLNNTWTHWNKQSLDFIHGPQNFCNNSNITIFCDNYSSFRLITRMSGKVLFVDTNKNLVLKYFEDTIDVFNGSDVWTTCSVDSSKYILKNIYTNEYLNYNNHSFVISEQFTSIIVDTNDILLGYTLIKINCDAIICVMGYDNDILDLKQFYLNDLWSQWNKQLI